MASSKHKQIKKDIEEYFRFFKDNIKRYKRSMRFAYKETLDDEARAALQVIDKPPLEVNYIQTYLSRLIGEYSNQSPGVVVSGNDTGDDINVDMVDLVEGHMRVIVNDFHDNGSSNQVFKEQCGGGFSVIKISTEYRTNKTFQQDIVWGTRDPVMCFFDPMAKLPSKSDGKFSGEIYPMLKTDFKKKYPDFAEKADGAKYSGDTGAQDAPFMWSYKDRRKSIVLLADYYRLEGKNYTLCQLADDSEMSESDYNKMVKEWSGLAPPPAITKRRQAKSSKVKRYILFGEDIIDEEITSLPGLPYVFVDGDSAFVYKDDKSDELEQVVHSYIYNAMDAQRLLNFTVQTIANFSENYMQQKFIVDQAAMIDGDSWTSPQKASVLLKRSIDDSGNPISEPVKSVVQQDLPSSVMTMFSSMQNVMQNSFGTYDRALGINDNNLSGEAIKDGSTQSNMTSMPFKNGYLSAITTAAQLTLKMIPLYYVTPMTIPYSNDEGERKFIKINQNLKDGSADPESMRVDYGEDDLDVKVKSGYSFAIQQDKSLKMLAVLSDKFPAIKKLVDEKGTSIVLGNLNMRDSDKLMQLAIEQQKEVANQPNQPNPIEQKMMLEQQELALKEKQMQSDAKLKSRELDIREEESANQVMIEKIKLERDVINDTMRRQTHAIDSASKVNEQAMKEIDQEHRHTLDIMKAHK